MDTRYTATQRRLLVDAHIRRRGGWVTKGELTQHFTAHRRLYGLTWSGSILDRVLGQLVELGWAEFERRRTAGRPARAWRALPRV